MRRDDGRSILLMWLFAPLRFAYKLWFALIFWVSLAFLYPLFKLWLRHPRHFRKAFLLKRVWGQVLQWGGLFPQRVRFRAPLPAPPYIVISNHSSYIDIVQMFNLVPDYFLMMGKYELKRWPLFRMFFKDMDIAVDRTSRVGSAKAFRRAAAALDAGASIVMFPEGTIPYDVPRMKPFKDGAFRLAIEKQVPIVPVTFTNHWRLFGDPEDLLSRGHPGISRAIVHPPLRTAGLSESDLVDLRHKAFDVIQGPMRADEA
ncbi:MAG: 1-acyl-sn-glycerol-3-phosphate acyltransferase [Flavobacteriales bacterium]|nr:1-acyl-sn-glycerol-3-phosphate acyltransferase [Flavobacteriales bacterium]MCB9166770.1 1-acyl-sn-glycerol-3-phosphate acyltransferase [Flavobacteriales bacterium]